MTNDEKIKKIKSKILRLEKVSNSWLIRLTGQMMIKIIASSLTCILSLIALKGLAFLRNKEDSYVNWSILILVGLIVFILLLKWFIKNFIKFRIKKLNNKLIKLKAAANIVQNDK